MDHAERVPPERLRFEIAAFGDQFPGEVEHIFVTKTD